tara:strand:- start:1206 stop:1367 length:162 start_codon:yes stop_codon:yes gene_type:complete
MTQSQLNILAAQAHNALENWVKSLPKLNQVEVAYVLSHLNTKLTIDTIAREFE